MTRFPTLLAAVTILLPQLQMLELYAAAPTAQAPQEPPHEADLPDVSENNLKQIGLAMHNFHDRHKTFPPRASLDRQGKPLLSWRVHLLPYLDEQALYQQFHHDEPWDSLHNRKLLERMPDIYRTPRRKHDNKTCYLVPVGKGTIWERPESLSRRQIRDGLSNTILVVEVNSARAVEWTRPADLDYDPKQPLRGLYNVWKHNTFRAVIADGAIQSVTKDINADTLRGIFTANGGEEIDWPD